MTIPSGITILQANLITICAILKICTLIYSINSFIPIARVIMVASCSSYRIRTLNVFCVAWWKGLRRIWKLPSNSHCILPIISKCLPIFDELCRRFGVFLILLAPVLSTTVLLFDSSPIIMYYGTVHARSSGGSTGGPGGPCHPKGSSSTNMV
jgi:hypothetical protein